MAQLYTWPGEGGTSTPADLQAVQPGQGKDVVRTSQTGPREPEGQRVVIRMVSSRSDSGSDVSGGDDREGVDVDDGGGVAYSGVTPSSVGGDGSRLVERRRDRISASTLQNNRLNNETNETQATYHVT